jgi:hypothetical protein
MSLDLISVDRSSIVSAWEVYDLTASCRKELQSATLRQSFFWQWLLYPYKGIEPNKKPSGIDHGDQ